MPVATRHVTQQIFLLPGEYNVSHSEPFCCKRQSDVSHSELFCCQRQSDMSHSESFCCKRQSDMSHSESFCCQENLTCHTENCSVICSDVIRQQQTGLTQALICWRAMTAWSVAVIIKLQTLHFEMSTTACRRPVEARCQQIIKRAHAF